MRVLECNTCGEVIGAGSNDELVERLSAHMEREHPEVELDHGALRTQVQLDAYDAADA